jgi:hypothetical protein
MNTRKFRSFFTSALLALALLALGVALPAMAQTTTNPPAMVAPTPTGLLTSLSSYVSSRNTNFTYQSALIWTGPVWENQINFGNELGASYDFYQSNLTNGIFASVESRTRTAGIAGTFVSEGVGLEGGWLSYDVKIGVFLDGVYKVPEKSGAAEFGLFGFKLMTPNTGVGLFASWQTGQHYPIIGGQLNLSFGSGNGFLGLL